MSIDARIVASDEKGFRIIRQEEGDKVRYVLEKPDGFDALGCERWKEVNVGQAETISRYLRDWIIAHALKCDAMKERA